MQTEKKSSKRSLLINVATFVSMTLPLGLVHASTAKEFKEPFCVNNQCSNVSVKDEIENAMRATAANIHLWSGNRSYKSLLKAIIISSAQNNIGKIVEINHHLLAMSLDVGNLRMARESISIINRFAPQSLTRLNQTDIFNKNQPNLTLFQRLNLNSKFAERELELINNNFKIQNDEYAIGPDSFNIENAGEEYISDSIYDLSNSGTGEVFYYAKKAQDRTDTLFSKLQDKMAQLSYKKSDCTLQYVAKIREAVVLGALGGAAIGNNVNNRILKVPAIIGGAVVGGIANGISTKDKEKVELEKCNDGAEDSVKNKTDDAATSADQQNNTNEQKTEDDEDTKKRLQESSVNSESPDSDLQDTGTSSTDLVDLLKDYYNEIKIGQFENFNVSILTIEQMQIKINSVVNFGNKESEQDKVSAEQIAQQAIQKQNKWTTPVKSLKNAN